MISQLQGIAKQKVKYMLQYIELVGKVIFSFALVV